MSLNIRGLGVIVLCISRVCQLLEGLSSPRDRAIEAELDRGFENVLGTGTDGLI
jgi:hypothetical protein